MKLRLLKSIQEVKRSVENIPDPNKTDLALVPCEVLTLLLACGARIQGKAHRCPHWHPMEGTEHRYKRHLITSKEDCPICQIALVDESVAEAELLRLDVLISDLSDFSAAVKRAARPEKFQRHQRGEPAFDWSAVMPKGDLLALCCYFQNQYEHAQPLCRSYEFKWRANRDSCPPCLCQNPTAQINTLIRKYKLPFDHNLERTI